MGEIAALHAAGVMDDVSAVRIACQRGKFMGQLPGEDGGAMLAVMAPVQQLQALMAESGQQVHIANYNSTRQTVLSDDRAAIAQLARLLEERKISHRLLKVSHAFHSRFVAPAALPFGQCLQKMSFAAPQGQVISSMTAATYDSSSNIAEQLANQIVEPVQFVQAINKVAADEPDMWIEVGPGNVLGQFVNDVVDGAECFATDIGNDDGSRLLNNIMARAFVIGCPVRLEQLFNHRFYRPFDLEHYQPELIVNPCERPYETPEVGDGTGIVLGDRFSALRPADVDEQAFNDYLAVRGDYLRELIALDLKHAQPSAARPAATAALPIAVTVDKVGPVQTPQSVQDFVMAWVAERTGYPLQSIDPGKRLRDDLNLDSIKVGELAIAMGQHLNARLAGDPSALSNVTLQEFVERLEIDTPPVIDAPAHVVDQPVQTYRMDYQPCALEQEEAALAVRNRHGLLVPLLDGSAVAAIEAELRRAGAKLDVLQPAELATTNIVADFLIVLAAGEARHFVETLTADPQASIAAEASALVRVMQQAAARLDLRKCKTLVVSLERGNGTLTRAGAAMLKTLHQEYGGAMKWLALPADGNTDWLAKTVCAELETAGQHIGYVYRDGQRHAELTAPVQTSAAPGFSPLNANDVVLVTGGAKGITAELVMALALQSGATLALLGSSAASHPDVVAGLQRFAAAGIRHEYYMCDVADSLAVHATLQQVRADLGEPRGVFHGAGVSGLHPFTQLSESEFMRCFRVKAQGLWNILHGVDLTRLKMLHVISSIIGKMGMHGQADYAYANAWLDEAVRDLAYAYPKLHCLTLGYSVWKGTGIGHKLGVVESLERRGVSAISVEQGVAAYLQLMSAPHPGPVHVIIGSLPDAQRSVIMSSRPVVTGRFIEMISDWLPEAAITVEAVLNHRVDRYIAEHVYQGTPLMPGVVALEAMTQVVMACRNKDQRPTRIEEIVFYRPLIVPFGVDTRVQISARKREGQGDSYGVELFANKVRYYSATFVFDSAPVEGSAPIIGAPLPLSAESYNPYPLFQGKFFRRIANIRKLEAGASVISEIRVPKREELGIFMPEGMHVSAVVRDTFLQTGALALPNGYLPAAMQNYFINAELPEGESVFCECRILSDMANSKLADISIFDKGGRLLEKIAGITLRISAEGLNIQQCQFEPEPVATAIERRLGGLSLHGIGMALLRAEDETASSGWLQDDEIAALRERVSAARFDTSRNNVQAAKQALARIRNIDVNAIEVHHAPDGRPMLAAKTAAVQEVIAGLEVSISDSHGLSLAIVATGPVGIDLEPVQERDANSWFLLLGAEDYRRAEAITYQSGEPYGWSATRVWTMREALRKAGIEPTEVRLERLTLEQGWYQTHFVVQSQRYILSSAMVDLGAPGEQPAALTLVFVDQQPATVAPLLNLTASSDPLSRVEQCLDEFGRQLELGSHAFGQDPQHALTEAHQQYVRRIIDETLQTLREAAPSLNREQTKRLQQRGYELIRRYGQQSNIFYRVLEKPLGYPGDHVLLDRMFRNQVHTTGLAYHLDRCFLDYAGTEAVRQRTYWVVRKLLRMLDERGLRQLKILDLGAGPMAIERTLAHRFDGMLSITALDFDNNSFEYAKAAFDVPAEFYTEQQNLVSPEGIRRIREAAATVDVVCSMGLIEYLGEEAVVAILGAIHQGIRPGAQVFTSNYVPHHWSQASMEWFLDWWLVYRSPQKMAELAVKAGFRREDVELSMDPTGSITLMRLTRH
ncbi:MAG: SDR family NAD(P)-dependent oxidoreductase [Polyangiaceae bacterium]|nr:SDR family NAD(P)-dependent oxidoreductase [Polyangiaceae bacterium]